LGKVDVFQVTADNISESVKARIMKRPSVGELGEANDKYIVGTAEILIHPLW